MTVAANCGNYWDMWMVFQLLHQICISVQCTCTYACMHVCTFVCMCIRRTYVYAKMHPRGHYMFLLFLFKWSQLSVIHHHRLLAIFRLLWCCSSSAVERFWCRIIEDMEKLWLMQIFHSIRAAHDNGTEGQNLQKATCRSGQTTHLII